jgi:hypothetical protein
MTMSSQYPNTNPTPQREIKESPRYSFRMIDGTMPFNAGKLSWVSCIDRAIHEANTWGASHLLVLHQMDDSARWRITDEIEL